MGKSYRRMDVSRGTNFILAIGVGSKLVIGVSGRVPSSTTQQVSAAKCHVNRTNVGGREGAESVRGVIGDSQSVRLSSKRSIVGRPSLDSR